MNQRRRQEVLTPLEKKSRRLWFPLIVGQIIALLSASSNASSFTLNQHFGLDTQFFQMFWFYLLLSLHLFFRKERPPTATDSSEPCYTLPGTKIRLHIPWWIYLIISMLDVFPNFMTLLSLRYTSITSTTLLGSLTVPSTMFFSRYILARLFTPVQYAGVCLCLAGGILTVWSDVEHADDDGGGVDLVHNTSMNAATTTDTTEGGASYRYVGDLLAVTAALAYGLGDTISEFAIKHIDREEYLGMLGVYGVIFTGLIFPWLEGDALRHLFHLPVAKMWQAIATLIWYVASVLLYYTTQASFLVTSDATLLNLSLQASNLWVILFSVVVYQDLPPAVFYLAVTLVVAGVFVYEKGGGAAVTAAKASNETDEGLEVEPLQSQTKTDEGSYRTMDKL
jgi:drug/metabolite transporter (DMT)-like permease